MNTAAYIKLFVQVGYLRYNVNISACKKDCLGAISLKWGARCCDGSGKPRRPFNSDRRNWAKEAAINRRNVPVAIVFSLVMILFVLAIVVGADSARANHTTQIEPAITSDSDVGQTHLITSTDFRLRQISTSPLMPNWMLASFDWPEPPRYSKDGGRSWFPMPATPWTSLPYNRDIQVVLVPKEDFSETPRFMVGVDIFDETGQANLYRSGDLGISWFRQTLDVSIGGWWCNTSSKYSLGFDGYPGLFALPATPEHVYAYVYCYYMDVVGATTVDETFVSHDHGITWDTTDALQFSRVVVSPSNPLHIYGVSHEYPQDWYESLDGGDTWSTGSFGILDFPTIGAGEVRYGILFRIEWPGPVLIGFGRRSPDGGNTWIDWELPPDCPYTKENDTGFSIDGRFKQLLAHPTIPNLLLLRCKVTPDQPADIPARIMRSLDGGNSWSQIDAPAGYYLTLDYGHPGRLLGVSDCESSSPNMCGGLWYSDDGGTTWDQLTADFSGFSQLSKRVYLPVVIR